MPTVDTLSNELGVDVADIQVWISELLELDLHDEDLPAEIAAEVRDVFSPAGERALPPLRVELALAYRERPDRALLTELEMHGHRLAAHALVLERVLPPEDAAPYAAAIDQWLADGTPPHVLTPPRRR